MDYSPYTKEDVNLAIELKEPAGWKVTRPWEDVLVPHENDSHVRGLPTAAAKEKVQCGGYIADMLPKCKGKKLRSTASTSTNHGPLFLRRPSFIRLFS